MTLRECLSDLQIEKDFDTFTPEWDDSQKKFPETIPFLDPRFLKDVSKKYFVDTRILEALLSASQHLAENEAARRLLWHQHYLVVQNYERCWLSCYRFPELPVLGAHARAYYLLLALSGAFYFGDVHAKLGIPSTDLEATIEEIRHSIRASMERKNLIGVAPHFSGWWQGFFSGRLYRLGRLSFLQEKYTWPFHVFENVNSKELCVLSGDGLDYNERGLRPLKGEVCAWRSHYSEKNGRAAGQAIGADGYARKPQIELDLKEWRKSVSPGENTLSVHIAAGAPMDAHACIESFQQAKIFFEKYFPNKPFKLFTCDSWLLDPQLKTFLPESSNIVQFQKRFHLAPSAVDAEFVPIRTIFGAEVLTHGIDSVVATTGLQKGARTFKQKGGVLRHGYGLLPFHHEWKKETH